MLQTDVSKRSSRSFQVVLSLFSFRFIMTHKAERHFSSVDRGVHLIGYRELIFNGKDSILSKSISMRPARLFMERGATARTIVNVIAM